MPIPLEGAVWELQGVICSKSMVCEIMGELQGGDRSSQSSEERLFLEQIEDCSSFAKKGAPYFLINFNWMACSSVKMNSSLGHISSFLSLPKRRKISFHTPFSMASAAEIMIFTSIASNCCSRPLLTRFAGYAAPPKHTLHPV
jgi:hypothetical protein